MDLTSIFTNNIVPTIIGAGLTLLGTGLVRIFNNKSGIGDIVKNSEAITRTSESYAELQGLSLQDIKENGVSWNDQLGGLLVMDSNKAFITISKDNGPSSAFYDLAADERLVQFEHGKAKLSDLASLYQAAKLAPSETHKERAEIAACARKARKTWATPTIGQKIVALFSKQAAHDTRAQKISDAMMLTAKIMAASPEKDINLSGACHVAVKWTDENDKSFVVVMPTNEKERAIVKQALKGDGLAPDEAISGAQIVQNIEKLHL